MDIKQKISELEIRLQRLDRKFNFYFVGQDRVPPVKAFDQLKREVTLITREKDISASSSLRFYIETFLQKFISYRVKWEKGLRDIEEGRLSRGADFFKGRKFTRAEVKSSNAQKPMDVVFLETENNIRQVTEEYSSLYKRYFHKSCNKAKLNKYLHEQMEEIRAKYGDDFFLDVNYDGKDIKIKPVRKN